MRTRERRDWLLRRLREGGVRRAEDLAAEIGASPRTIYRDMAALRASGLPVMGERGLGYVATAPMMLPAMTLEAEEAAALGAALSRLAGSDDPLARAAGSLLARIGSPGALVPDRQGLERLSAALPHLAPLGAAIRARQKVRVDGRVLRPLALDHWAGGWRLIGWDEGELHFCDLALHEIAAVSVLPELFVDEDGRRLEDARRGSGPWKDETSVPADHQP